ncbi:MAG TPA: hypothetical protein VFD66_03955, partial [Verrucomicrobiae bacterium]|nr:hypothetical protein [Verrucomicrobiae bacterium]
DIQALNKRFFIEVRNWFYWARLQARFPDGAKKDADKRDSEALIRLLTRMIFVWFLREKRLIADELFAERTIETLARDWRVDDCEKDKQGRYYKAILQNLFFATLNTPIEERKFRSARSYQGKNKHYGDQRYFRHVALFHEKAPVEELYKTIPFLNGGLFEMLDEIPGRGDDSITEEKRVDGFSDVADKQPLVPDFLFFGDERRVPELSALLGESTAPKARGLLKIFRDYKFTIEENTPLEQDIALDPELLGRAFENLLAAVNPETGTVARKSTGSFYTPREIVNYMVEEAIRLRPDSTKMTPDFLVFALSSRIVRTQIEELGKTTAGNIGISGGDAKSFVVPVPPLPEQRRIVFELDALQAEVDALKRLHAETAPGLDALAPRHPSAFAWLLRDRRPRLHPPSSHFGGTRRRIVNPKELLEKLPLVRGWIDRTLSAFMRSGVIHDAGRGWYSRIAEGKSESAVL